MSSPGGVMGLGSRAGTVMANNKASCLIILKLVQFELMQRIQCNQINWQFLYILT